MKSILLTLAVLVLAACTPQHDHQRAGALRISVPWSRETPPGTSVAVGYVTVQNTGTTDDRLLRVESPAAKRVELHESTMAGGVMRMQALPDGIAIPAGQTVVLGPGGTHLMFIEPTHPPHAGDRLDATLVFRNAGRLRVGFDVRPLTAQDAGEHAHMQH